MHAKGKETARPSRENRFLLTISLLPFFLLPSFFKVGSSVSPVAFIQLRIQAQHSKIKEKRKEAAASAQWVRTAKNWDVSNGPLARPFALSLAPLTHSLARHCWLRLRAPLRSLVCSLAHSLTPQLVGKWMTRCLTTTWFCPTVKRVPPSLRSVSPIRFPLPHRCSLIYSHRQYLFSYRRQCIFASLFLHQVPSSLSVLATA